MTKDSQTTPRYVICIKEDGKVLYVASGSHGWSLHSDANQATSWEYERDALEAQKRAPLRIRFDGYVLRQSFLKGEAV